MTRDQWLALKEYIDARFDELIGDNFGRAGGFDRTMDRKNAEEKLMALLLEPQRGAQ